MSNSNDPHDSEIDKRETYSYGGRDHSAHTSRSGQSHASFFTPFLSSGMNLLDCGCGPGTITVDLAEIVAPGDVFGFDVIADSLPAAGELAKSRGLTNVRFDEASIYQIPAGSATVDAVFVHAVLHHLSDPAAALREIWRVRKPGGVVGVREPDFGGIVQGPSDAPGKELYEHWASMLEQNGGNAYLGRDLRKLFHQASYQDIVCTASYETHGTPETIDWFRNVATQGLEPDGALGLGLLKSGILDQASLAELKQNLLAWCDDPGAFLARNWCEAVGWKHA